MNTVAHTLAGMVRSWTRPAPAIRFAGPLDDPRLAGWRPDAISDLPVPAYVIEAWPGETRVIAGDARWF